MSRDSGDDFTDKDGTLPQPLPQVQPQRRAAGQRTAVIGGGWAGFAAAVELARAGRQVTVFEAARTLGGRARHVPLDDRSLDNGQHILLGAYSEVLRHMKLVGVDARGAFLRLPLQMRYPPQEAAMDFVAPRLPAPFHLLAAVVRAKGLDRADKMALARFSTTARWMDWRLDQDCSVAELLERYDQTERLTRLLWRPLCIAALTTSPHEASAQVFLNVLRDSLGARRGASDMLIPVTDLTSLYPRHAAAFVAAAGGAVHAGASVKSIAQRDGLWQLSVNGECPGVVGPYDQVIVATHATQAASLLADLVDTGDFMQFGHESITTCYLQYGGDRDGSADVRLPAPFYALLDVPEKQEWAQFVFDRGWLDKSQSGMLAAVISASQDAVSMGHEALAASVASQLARALRMPALEKPRWSRVITEKRASFSCRPSLRRPANATALPGLAVAGDYTEGDYPSTLEGAVRSGVRAARLFL